MPATGVNSGPNQTGASGLRVEISARARYPVARLMGARLAAGLRGLQQRFDCIGDARGRGLLLGLEFRGAGGRDAAAVSDAVTDLALELGLLANIVRAGASQGVMRIAPPLTVTEAEVDLGVELLGEAVGKVMRSS